MKTKIISIIGGRGKMGQLFAREFEKQGFKVLISGRNTEITNIEAAKRGDIVIVSVPIRETEKVIREIGEHVRKDALLSDFTSIKINPNKAMKKYSKAEVIGGHPVFGPNVNLAGQNFILTPVRGKEFLIEYKGILNSLGLNVIIMTGDEHDKMMAIIQCLNHINNLVFAETLRKLSANIQETEKLASPAYLLKLYSVGRFLEYPELYSDIIVENPYSKKIMKDINSSIREIGKFINSKNKNELEKLMLLNKENFGMLTKKSLELTNKFLDIINKNKENEK